MGFSDFLPGGTKDSTTSSGAMADNQNLAALQREARQTKRKTSKLQESLDAERDAAELNKLFAEENWQEVAGIYFHARFAMTGWDGFLLDSKQKAILGTTLAASMRLLLAIDPAYIALAIFSINMGAFIAQREVAYAQITKKERQNGPGTRTPA